MGESLLNFQVFSGLPLNFQDISKLPLNFQNISGIGARWVGDFILQPGILYPFRSRNTYLSWRKKESRMGYVQNFPLTANVCFAGSGLKDSRGILEIDQHFLQCSILEEVEEGRGRDRKGEKDSKMEVVI
jgi:hypothetical protein